MNSCRAAKCHTSKGFQSLLPTIYYLFKTNYYLKKTDYYFKTNFLSRFFIKTNILSPNTLLSRKYIKKPAFLGRSVGACMYSRYLGIAICYGKFKLFCTFIPKFCTKHETNRLFSNDIPE